MTFQTLCGTPGEVADLTVVPNEPFHTLTVTWTRPTQPSGSPNNIQYVVRL